MFFPYATKEGDVKVMSKGTGARSAKESKKVIIRDSMVHE
jgi:hypothetical protein